MEQRDALFAIITALFEENDKALYKRIAALVVKIFVEVESSQFERRNDTILSILSKELDVKNFKLVRNFFNSSFYQNLKMFNLSDYLIDYGVRNDSVGFGEIL